MADQNKNPGSKQADGSDDSSAFKAKPTDKEGMGGSGGRTGSGVGGGSKDAGSSGGSKTGGNSGAGGSIESDKGYSAGKKNNNEETDDGEDLSGETGSGKSGSTIR